MKLTNQLWKQRIKALTTQLKDKTERFFCHPCYEQSRNKLSNQLWDPLGQKLEVELMAKIGNRFNFRSYC